MTAPTTEHETWTPDLTFGARLALVRHQMGWNIKEAALACGIKPQNWRGYELDGRIPHNQLRVVDQIAARTRIDPQWLMDGFRVERTDRESSISRSPSLTERPRRDTTRPPAGRPKGRPDTPAASGPPAGTRRPARVPRPRVDDGIRHPGVVSRP